MLNFLLTRTPILYLTQSVWRDEAFSILVAEKPISFFFGKLTFEPPFYYVLLHFWIKLFGESEIAARSLSFLAFALATGVVIVWAEKLFKKHWLSVFLPLFFFLNPMLLYYAFEIRTYGWYIFFSVLAMYAYLEKKWRLFVAASVLGFYTHSFFILLPAVSFIHYALAHRRRLFSLRPRRAIANPMIQSLVSIGLLITPWLFVIVRAASKLSTSWYFPVNWNLVRSVLGNMFFGYEGTPGGLWEATAVISLVLVLLFAVSVKLKEERNKTSFFLLAIFIPLTLIIGISFFKPMFVNRYLIFVTVAEVFLLGFTIKAIRSSWLQNVLGVTLIAVVLGSLVAVVPSFHRKVNIRATIQEIMALKSDRDIVLAETPLVLFETIYYSTNRNGVFLYNPDNVTVPWYIGDTIISSAMMTNVLPHYPTRAFLVREDGTFIVVYLTNSVATKIEKARKTK